MSLARTLAVPLALYTGAAPPVAAAESPPYNLNKNREAFEPMRGLLYDLGYVFEEDGSVRHRRERNALTVAGMEALLGHFKTGSGLLDAKELQAILRSFAVLEDGERLYVQVGEKRSYLKGVDVLNLRQFLQVQEYPDLVDDMRAVTAFLAGIDEWREETWERLQVLAQKPGVRKALPFDLSALAPPSAVKNAVRDTMPNRARLLAGLSDSEHLARQHTGAGQAAHWASVFDGHRAPQERLGTAMAMVSALEGWRDAPARQKALLKDERAKKFSRDFAGAVYERLRGNPAGLELLTKLGAAEDPALLPAFRLAPEPPGSRRGGFYGGDSGVNLGVPWVRDVVLKRINLREGAQEFEKRRALFNEQEGGVENLLAYLTDPKEGNQRMRLLAQDLVPLYAHELCHCRQHKEGHHTWVRTMAEEHDAFLLEARVMHGELGRWAKEGARREARPLWTIGTDEPYRRYAFLVNDFDLWLRESGRAHRVHLTGGFSLGQAGSVLGLQQRAALQAIRPVPSPPLGQAGTSGAMLASGLADLPAGLEAAASMPQWERTQRADAAYQAEIARFRKSEYNQFRREGSHYLDLLNRAMDVKR